MGIVPEQFLNPIFSQLWYLTLNCKQFLALVIPSPKVFLGACLLKAEVVIVWSPAISDGSVLGGNRRGVQLIAGGN